MLAALFSWGKSLQKKSRSGSSQARVFVFGAELGPLWKHCSRNSHNFLNQGNPRITNPFGIFT